MVTLDPDIIWPARALADVTNPWLYDTASVIATYDELVSAATGEFDRELDRGVWAAKHGLALASIERLGNTSPWSPTSSSPSATTSRR